MEDTGDREDMEDTADIKAWKTRETHQGWIQEVKGVK